MQIETRQLYKPKLHYTIIKREEKWQNLRSIKKQNTE